MCEQKHSINTQIPEFTNICKIVLFLRIVNFILHCGAWKQHFDYQEFYPCRNIFGRSIPEAVLKLNFSGKLNNQNSSP